MATKVNEEPAYHLLVNGISKKFHQNKLFTNLSFQLSSNQTLAITGSNGSGKSTLLKIIAGILPPLKGDINLKEGNKIISKEEYYKQVNICAPYIDLIDEFTLLEQLEFHHKFKEIHHHNTIDDIISFSGLKSNLNKPIKLFSSGMKQRVKLILALCFKGSLVLLDEPSSHLDENSKEWYKNLMEKFCTQRICIIFSNDSKEYDAFTNNLINIES